MNQKFGVSDLRGAIAVTPTPATPDADRLDARETVDLAETEKMIRNLIADGIDGIMTNGTLGEVATLTLDEWKAFAQRVAETVAQDAPDLPLFIGATTLSSRDTADRLEFLRQIGVRGTFLGRPMWSALGPDTLVKFYEQIVDAYPEMAICLYDNAEAFKGPIPPPVYAKLAKIRQIIGAKYTAITPKYRADMDAVDGRIRLMPIESDWLSARTLYPDEAIACWSSSALCGPSPVTYLRDALDAGDEEGARWVTHRVEWTYEPFLARQNFAEFSKYNITLEKVRFDEAGYVTAGPSRPPYQTAPVPYIAGARENGRRWRKLTDEVDARTRTIAITPSSRPAASSAPAREQSLAATHGQARAEVVGTVADPTLHVDGGRGARSRRLPKPKPGSALSEQSASAAAVSANPPSPAPVAGSNGSGADNGAGASNGPATSNLPMHDRRFADWLGKLKDMTDGPFDREGPVQDEQLVSHSADAVWIESDITKTPARIGVVLGLPAKTMDFYLQEILEGGSSDMQRHIHESVHYVIEGSGYSEIGPETVQWGAGDFVYTPPWIWHRHYNTGRGSVRMLLVENAPLLDHLGLNRRDTAGLAKYSDLNPNGEATRQ